jgi:hypothetical protein
MGTIVMMLSCDEVWKVYINLLWKRYSQPLQLKVSWLDYIKKNGLFSTRKWQLTKEDSWRRIHSRMGQECSGVGEQAVYIGAAKKRVFRVIYFK